MSIILREHAHAQFSYCGLGCVHTHSHLHHFDSHFPGKPALFRSTSVIHILSILTGQAQALHIPP